MKGNFRTPLPHAASLFGRIVNPLHRFFDWLYHSEYNPLYRSGTLAVGFLVVLLVTGLYLLFFYSVSAPYESVTELQSQAYLGRWVRALHRYATDGVIIATVFHILQLLVQGKTWGPRTLAWLSGIVLLGMILISAWTGYVLVWDTHGQLLAIAGASLLKLFPFLHDVVSGAFNGTNPVTPSFFFMNLFLHVALPVGLIFGLWVHTAKLSRSRWFPLRPIFFWSTLALIVLAVFWQAPLMLKADLLALPGIVSTDLFVGFWIPLALHSPPLAFSLLVLILIVLTSMPWVWRPSAMAIRKTSVVDLTRCTGCTQCARDCPYEAIIMVPRDDGKRLIAQVQPESCVSCGICAASCGDLCIGPPERRGVEQLAEVERFCVERFSQMSADDITVIACKHNGYVPDRWQKFALEQPGFHLYYADCCGTVHTEVMERLLQSCGGIFFHACPERNCFNRDGLDLLSQRIFYKRVPFLAREIDRRRLFVDSSSEKEHNEALLQAVRFRDSLFKLGDPDKQLEVRRRGVGQLLRRIIATAVLLFGTAAINQWPVGGVSNYALIRFGAKLPGQTKEECRPLSDEDKKTLPLHMQLPEICNRRQLRYRIRITLDDKELLGHTLQQSNLRGDGIFFINEEVEVSPGNNRVSVSVEPINTPGGKILSFSEEIRLEPQKIYLISYDQTTGALVLVDR